MRLEAAVVILILGKICEGRKVNVLGGGAHGLLNNMAIDKNSGKVRVSNEKLCHMFCFFIVQFTFKCTLFRGEVKYK